MADQAKKKKSKKPKEITITLSEPIEWGEDQITEIVMQRPKGKHLKSLSAEPSLQDLVKIAQKISGQPPRVFDDMDADDVLACAEAVGDFLDSGLQIGKHVRF